MRAGRCGAALSVAALAALAAIVACKGSTATTAPPASPTDACGSLYQALLDYGSCAGSAPSVNGHRDRFAQFCLLHVGAPGATGASDAASRCATAIRDATASCGSVDYACPTS